MIRYKPSFKIGYNVVASFEAKISGDRVKTEIIISFLHMSIGDFPLFFFVEVVSETKYSNRISTRSLFLLKRFLRFYSIIQIEKTFLKRLSH